MAKQTSIKLKLNDILTAPQILQLTGKPGIIEDVDVFMLLSNNSNITVSNTEQLGVRHYVSGAIFVPSPVPKKRKWEVTASGVHSGTLLSIAQMVLQRYRSNPDVSPLVLTDENNQDFNVFINSYTMPSDVLFNTLTGRTAFLNPTSIELEEI